MGGGFDLWVMEFALTSSVAHSHGIIKSVFPSNSLTSSVILILSTTGNVVAQNYYSMINGFAAQTVI